MVLNGFAVNPPSMIYSNSSTVNVVEIFIRIHPRFSRQPYSDRVQVATRGGIKIRFPTKVIYRLQRVYCALTSRSQPQRPKFSKKLFRIPHFVDLIAYHCNHHLTFRRLFFKEMRTAIRFLFALAHISVCLGIFVDIENEGRACAAMAVALPGLTDLGM
jgi:hypothetical protein